MLWTSYVFQVCYCSLSCDPSCDILRNMIEEQLKEDLNAAKVLTRAGTDSKVRG